MTRWVVVGGGTAGCAVAARLSEDPRRDVVLLEAGGGHRQRIGGWSTLADLVLPRSAARYPVAGHDYVQGRGLGGSSRINGALLSGDVPAELPREVLAADVVGPVDRALLASAADARPVTVARRDGRFVSTSDVFLASVRGRRNLEVVPRAAVARVVFDGLAVAGVEVAGRGFVAAERVVLCAGAIESPAILLRSGVEHAELGLVSDHAARTVDLTLRPGTKVDPYGLVTGAVLRRDGYEIVSMNHVGPDHPGRAALLVAWLASPRRGRVTLGEGGRADLAFDPLDGATADGLARGEVAVAELLATPPMRAVAVDWSVADELGGYFHAAGSCTAITDQRGAVNGIDGLFVADASVLPLPASGLYGPVVANALRLTTRW